MAVAPTRRFRNALRSFISQILSLLSCFKGTHLFFCGPFTLALLLDLLHVVEA